jgi:hypothetical protein
LDNSLKFLIFNGADVPGAPRQWWFGGGTDFTPAYIFEEDVKHFHSVLSLIPCSKDMSFVIMELLLYKLLFVVVDSKASL